VTETSARSARPPGPKVIALALDAGGCELVERWCREGHLPTLAALRERGPWLRLGSTTHIGSGAAWPSTYMGISPGQHGIYFPHRQILNGSYHIGKFYAVDILKRPPFWIVAARRGAKIAVFDAPYTRRYEESDIEGIQISGWGNLADYSNKGSWPPELMQELKDEFGHHPLEGWYHSQPRTIAGWRQLRQQFLDSVRKRGEIAEALLRREDWDLFVADFEEIHYAAHFFWHLMDPTHPDHDPEAGAAVGDTLLAVYREVDRALARLLDGRDDATVLVFSNQGMGANYSGNHLLPAILARLGMSGGRGRAAPVGPRAIRALLQRVPTTWVEALKELVPTGLWDTWTRRALFFGNGWKDSRAFFLPSDYSGGIRVNLKGREPHGTVAPGEEYEALCRELMRELASLENPETGKSAVREIFLVRDRYRGDHLDGLADLMVVWEEDAPIRALASPTIGTVAGSPSDEMAMTAVRSGGHRDEAFLAAAGPQIRTDAFRGAGSVMDIAPTVLRLLGQPVPDYMDGRVLTEIFDPPTSSADRPAS